MRKLSSIQGHSPPYIEAYRTTPTAATHKLLSIPPLHIHNYSSSQVYFNLSPKSLFYFHLQIPNRMICGRWRGNRLNPSSFRTCLKPGANLFLKTGFLLAERRHYKYFFSQQMARRARHRLDCLLHLDNDIYRLPVVY
ncbi:hypothetical protein AVEN_221139-1 [Araneus ventricosus]|uniref:Uncharacterized protein n=1 Tax=Araneus ventricosus TaxID=182803 RepID=A0A4Y2TBQ9_ARAVE|nr:hypothetical protein AVEN_221139-1 [Araneus ventricosus]